MGAAKEPISGRSDATPAANTCRNKMKFCLAVQAIDSNFVTGPQDAGPKKIVRLNATFM